MQARTFHAAALRQLRYFWPRVVGGEVPRISERKVAADRRGRGSAAARAGPTGLRDLAAEIEWAKVTRTSPGRLPRRGARAGREARPGWSRDHGAAVYAGYEEAKRAAR